MIKKMSILLQICMFLFSCSSVNNTTSVLSSPKATIAPSPSILPTPMVIVTPSPTLAPTPTLIPTLPSQTPNNKTADIKSDATINGYVYDDGGYLLEDATVTVKSLEKDISFFGETKTLKGSYVFRNVPVGIKLELKASKVGLNERITSYVSKSNSIGNSKANVINFGDEYPVNDILNKVNFNFLTAAPEITTVFPQRESVVKNYNFKLKFTFSKPVKKEIVERYFVLRYLKDNITRDAVLGNGEGGTDNTDGPPLLLGNKQIIIDQNSPIKHFDWDTPQYDSFGKEFNFYLSDGYALPTLNNKRVLYGVSMRGLTSSVKFTDSDGNYSFNVGEFFISETNRAKNYLFYVDSDQNEPYLESAGFYKSQNNDTIRLNFSEPMNVIGYNNSDLLDLSNYKFYKNGTLITISNSTVVITTPNPKNVEFNFPLQTFSTSDTIEVEVNPNLKDPAGNFLSQGVTLGEKDNIKKAKYLS